MMLSPAPAAGKSQGSARAVLECGAGDALGIVTPLWMAPIRAAD